jgi:hypothetical protein
VRDPYCGDGLKEHFGRKYGFLTQPKTPDSGFQKKLIADG